ncbi:hypothetical protein BH23CHL5_BH23CHL5_08440 [soil metagenome]
MSHPERSPDVSGRTARFARTAGSASTIDCASVHDLAYDYVLAASDDAKDAIENHCSQCARCRDLINDLSSTSSMLAYSVPLSTPSLATKASLFARIDQAARVERTHPSVFAGSLESFRTPTIPSSSASVSSEAGYAPSEDSGNRWSRILAYAAPLATVPLLLTLGFVGYWGASAHMDRSAQSKTIETLNAEVQLLDYKLTDLSAGIEGIDQFVGSESAKTYAMRDPYPEADASGAQGMLIANPAGDKAILVASKLDPTVDSYQVILGLTNGEVQTISTMFCDQDGEAIKLLEFDVPLSEIATIHVKPSMAGFTTDSRVASTLPDVLRGTIWPGLNGEGDTKPSQP